MARPRTKRYTLAAERVKEDGTSADDTNNFIQSTIDPASLPPEQRAIAERVNSQDDGWRQQITEDDLTDFSLSEHKLKLPPEAQNLRDTEQFAFRWCTCTPKRVDELTRSIQRPERWWVVTRDFCHSHAKDMLAEIDDIHGGIVRIGQIMLFKPYRDSQIVQNAKNRISSDVAASRELKGAAERLAKPEDGIEAMAGKEYKIGGKDYVMQAEEPADAGRMGEEEGTEAE
jgi:hypothetical protein